MTISEIRKRLFQALRKVSCPCRTQDQLIEFMNEIESLYKEILESGK